MSAVAPSRRQRSRQALSSIQINQLVRLWPVAQAATERLPGTVLDVGSGTRGVARWLPRDTPVVAVDLSFDDYGASRGVTPPRPVQANAVALPFRDASFDVVTAVDLLEHVPPEDRARVIDELCRVTRHRLVLACPCDPGGASADRRVAAWLGSKGRTIPGWLDEHLILGLPDETWLHAELAQFGTVDLRQRDSAARQVSVILADLSPGRFVLTRLEAIALGLAYDRGGRARAAARRWVSRRSSSAGPSYRAMFVLDKQSELPSADTSCDDRRHRR